MIDAHSTRIRSCLCVTSKCTDYQSLSLIYTHFCEAHFRNFDTFGVARRKIVIRNNLPRATETALCLSEREQRRHIKSMYLLVLVRLIISCFPSKNNKYFDDLCTFLAFFSQTKIIYAIQVIQEKKINFETFKIKRQHIRTVDGAPFVPKMSIEKLNAIIGGGTCEK